MKKLLSILMVILMVASFSFIVLADPLSETVGEDSEVVVLNNPFPRPVGE